MGDRLIHSLAVRFADWLNTYVHNDKRNYLKTIYVTEAMLINIINLTLVFIAAAVLGVVVQTVAVMLGFNIIRRNAFGLHSKNVISCTIESLVLFVLAPYLLRSFTVENMAVLAVFCIMMIVVSAYAPADTEHRPLVGTKKRARFKKNAVICSAVLMLAVLLVPYGNIKLMLTLGAIYETVSLLPITYALFKRSYGNYKKYE